MLQEKRKIISNYLATSEFSYCRLVSSFSNRTSLGKVERVHDRVHFLLTHKKGCTYTIHRRQCELLMKEIPRTVMVWIPPTWDLYFFVGRILIMARNGEAIMWNKARFSKHGLQTVSNIAVMGFSTRVTKIGFLIVTSFCWQIRKLETIHCKCRLCATFIPNVGFIT